MHSGGTERNLSKNECSSSVSIAVIKFPDLKKNQFGAERVYFSSQFQVIVYHFKKVTVAGA